MQERACYNTETPFLAKRFSAFEPSVLPCGGAQRNGEIVVGWSSYAVSENSAEYTANSTYRLYICGRVPPSGVNMTIVGFKGDPGVEPNNS